MHWMTEGFPGMHLLWWLLGAGVLLLLIGAFDWLQRGPTRREQQPFVRPGGVRGGVFTEHDRPSSPPLGPGGTKEKS